MISETVGIGAIAVALIGLLTKVWLDSSKNVVKIIDVVEKNANAMTRLTDAVKDNTAVNKDTRKIINDYHSNTALLIRKLTRGNGKK